MPNDNTPDLLIDAPVAASEPPLGTFVTKDGRVVRVLMSERGEITLVIEGRGQPLAFDRWQSMSLTALLAERA